MFIYIYISCMAVLFGTWLHLHLKRKKRADMLQIVQQNEVMAIVTSIAGEILDAYDQLTTEVQLNTAEAKYALSSGSTSADAGFVPHHYEAKSASGAPVKWSIVINGMNLYSTIVVCVSDSVGTASSDVKGLVFSKLLSDLLPATQHLIISATLE